MNKDILVCGVGGQGTVLASKLLASAALKMGNKVHSAETIGMAQRGGPVTSYIRIGLDSYSPLIPSGGADMILAFEPSEAVRNLKYLKEDGIVIVNSVPVKPITESLNDTGYDGSEMIAYLKEKCAGVIVVDADEMCKAFGSSRYFNVAILGVAIGSGKTEITEEAMYEEIEKRVPVKFVENNKDAFAAGLEIGGAYAAK